MGRHYRVIGAFVLPNSLGDVDDTVYVDPDILDNPHFEAFMSHEVGHIEENSPDHELADKFASRLIGKKKVLLWLEAYKENIDVPVRIASLKKYNP